MSATQTAERSDLEARRESLYARLQEGYERIEQGIAEGRDVTTWGEFWDALLAEYDQVVERLTEERSEV